MLLKTSRFARPIGRMFVSLFLPPKAWPDDNKLIHEGRVQAPSEANCIWKLPDQVFPSSISVRRQLRMRRRQNPQRTRRCTSQRYLIAALFSPDSHVRMTIEFVIIRIVSNPKLQHGIRRIRPSNPVRWQPSTRSKR